MVVNLPPGPVSSVPQWRGLVGRSVSRRFGSTATVATRLGGARSRPALGKGRLFKKQLGGRTQSNLQAGELRGPGPSKRAPSVLIYHTVSFTRQHN